MTALQLLDHLRRVRQLEFRARSGSATGWNGQGHGTVETEVPLPDVVLFREFGTWQPEGKAGSVAFRNVYRWSMADARAVRLEHLRFGPDRPVFLLDLVRGANDPANVWRAAVPHLCVDDRYALRLEVQPAGLHAAWTIQGPKKQEQLDYTYAF